METSIAVIKNDSQHYLTEGQDLLLRAGELQVESFEQMKDAKALVKDCQLTEKEIEAKRIAITKPLNDFIKEVNGLFKEMTASLVAARGVVNKKVLSFNAEQERIRMEEQKKLIEDEKKWRDEHPEELTPEVAEKRRADLKDNLSYVASDTKVSGIVKRWTYEVVNEEEIPREFCSSDSKKINQAIRDGVRDIKGVRIYQAESVR